MKLLRIIAMEDGPAKNINGFLRVYTNMEKNGSELLLMSRRERWCRHAHMRKSIFKRSQSRKSESALCQITFRTILR